MKTKLKQAASVVTGLIFAITLSTSALANSASERRYAAEAHQKGAEQVASHLARIVERFQTQLAFRNRHQERTRRCTKNDPDAEVDPGARARR